MLAMLELYCQLTSDSNDYCMNELDKWLKEARYRRNSNREVLVWPLWFSLFPPPWVFFLQRYKDIFRDEKFDTQLRALCCRLFINKNSPSDAGALKHQVWICPKEPAAFPDVKVRNLTLSAMCKEP